MTVTTTAMTISPMMIFAMPAPPFALASFRFAKSPPAASLPASSMRLVQRRLLAVESTEQRECRN